ncbi:unnamed protein product [Protopolystoma xenopodis]|uniref:Uncharacterized protein n=1 Tax=Protopolystoma xenopodis TaxID=117903 RepID=A0A3S5AS86_9PLAT|nr:unnamed protein product [Protopolystoma xenopodis]
MDSCSRALYSAQQAKLPEARTRRETERRRSLGGHLVGLACNATQHALNSGCSCSSTLTHRAGRKLSVGGARSAQQWYPPVPLHPGLLFNGPSWTRTSQLGSPTGRQWRQSPDNSVEWIAFRVTLKPVKMGNLVRDCSGKHRPDGVHVELGLEL